MAEQEDEDDGGTGRVGGADPEMKIDLFTVVRNEINSEIGRKTGLRVPDPKDPYLQDEQARSELGHGARSGNKMESHPVTGQSARFHGMSDNTHDNSPEAQENFEQNQPSPQNQPRNELAHQNQAKQEQAIKMSGPSGGG